MQAALRDGRPAILRRLDGADAEALVALNRATAGDYGNLVPEPDEILTDVLVQREMLEDVDGGSRPLGAFVEGGLTGTATLFSVGLRKVAHVVELGLAVHPAWKRLGLGRALLEAALVGARERPGVSKVVARVFAHNEPELRLYRSAGFVEEGRQAAQYRFRDGSLRDLVWMARFLV